MDTTDSTDSTDSTDFMDSIESTNYHYYTTFLQKRNNFIQSSKNIIDNYLKNNDFENAFSKLIYLLISVESKEIPYILNYYQDLIKTNPKTT
jgi:hypothetical protein